LAHSLIIEYLVHVLLFCAAEIACATNGFNTLCQALEQTGLDHKLDDLDSNFTVFAPSDSAFGDILYDLQIYDIYDCPTETLRELLRVHIHENEVIDKNELEGRCGDLLEMASGDKTRTVCEDNKNRIFQKGAGNSDNDKPRVVTFDIDACNGIIHVVNTVILPRYVSDCEQL